QLPQQRGEVRRVGGAQRSRVNRAVAGRRGKRSHASPRTRAGTHEPGTYRERQRRKRVGNAVLLLSDWGGWQQGWAVSLPGGCAPAKPSRIQGIFFWAWGARELGGEPRAGEGAAAFGRRRGHAQGVGDLRHGQAAEEAPARSTSGRPGTRERHRQS